MLQFHTKGSLHGRPIRQQHFKISHHRSWSQRPLKDDTSLHYCGRGIIAGMYPAIFLDRDGVIMKNRPTYVRTWDDVEIIPDVLPALARLNLRPDKIVLITNQSLVGWGLISLRAAEMINQRLTGEIKMAGGRIDGNFMFPHKPDDNWTYRKPRPGLIFQAADTLALDLKRSVLIGETLTDLQVRFNADETVSGFRQFSSSTGCFV
ncbi:HAD-IIIA family hydrolase [Chloroflexota bacterium]